MYQLNSDSSFVQSVLRRISEYEGSQGRRTVQCCGMSKRQAGSFVRKAATKTGHRDWEGSQAFQMFPPQYQSSPTLTIPA